MTEDVKWEDNSRRVVYDAPRDRFEFQRWAGREWETFAGVSGEVYSTPARAYAFEHFQMYDSPPRICLDCGRPVDSFACKIRHLQINSGTAKAALM